MTYARAAKAKRAAEIVAREWERQSRQWEGAAKLLRKRLDASESDNDRLRAEVVALYNDINQARYERDAAEGELSDTLATTAMLEHRLGEAHQTLTVADEQG